MNRTPGRSGWGSTSPNAWRTPTCPALITMTLDETTMNAPMTVRSHAPVRSSMAPAVPPDARRPAAAVNNRNAATRTAPPSMREPNVCSWGRCRKVGSPQAYRETAASSSRSSGVSWISAARMFSSRCDTDDVPGITSMAGEWASSQASAIW